MKNDNQGKRPNQIRDSENITFIGYIGLILTFLILLITKN
jgi:hypothetical protein